MNGFLLLDHSLLMELIMPRRRLEWQIYFQSIDFDSLLSILDDSHVPAKNVEEVETLKNKNEYNKLDKNTFFLDVRAVNILYCALDRWYSIEYQHMLMLEIYDTFLKLRMKEQVMWKNKKLAYLFIIMNCLRWSRMNILVICLLDSQIQ